MRDKGKNLFRLRAAPRNLLFPWARITAPAGQKSLPAGAKEPPSDAAGQKSLPAGAKSPLSDTAGQKYLPAGAKSPLSDAAGQKSLPAAAVRLMCCGFLSSWPVAL